MAARRVDDQTTRSAVAIMLMVAAALTASASLALLPGVFGASLQGHRIALFMVLLWIAPVGSSVATWVFRASRRRALWWTSSLLTALLTAAGAVAIHLVLALGRGIDADGLIT